MRSQKPVNVMLFLSLILLGANAWPGEKIANAVAINPNRTLSWDDFKVVKVINGKSTINAICLSTCEVEILKVAPKGRHVSLDVKAIVEHQPELSQVTER